MISNVINQPVSLIKQAHTLIKESVDSGSIVIDATVGNGHDTRFLLDLVEPNGMVYGFDIQASAINSTKCYLQDLPFANCLTLIQANHAELKTHIATTHHGKINAIMFNLGYLPGGDKSIITQKESTLTALSDASRLLAVGGIITILAYPGHSGGNMETKQVMQWCLNLNPKEFTTALFENSPDNPLAPKLFVVNKLA